MKTWQWPASEERNTNRINEFRIAQNLSIGELAKRAGVSYSLIVRLNNGKCSPVQQINSPLEKNIKGNWKVTAEKIALALNVPVDLLFSKSIPADNPSLTNEQIIAICPDDNPSLTDEQVIAFCSDANPCRSVEALFEEKDFCQKIFAHVWQNLTDRQREVVSKIFLGYRNAEIAREEGISREAVGQLVEAIRKQFCESRKILNTVE